MSYCVTYGDKGAPSERKEPRYRVIFLSFFLFFLFLISVHAFWEEGREVVEAVIWPGDSDFTKQAFLGFVSDVHHGTPVMEALETFCQDIIVHGKGMH